MNKPILLSEMERLKPGSLCFLIASLLLAADTKSASVGKTGTSKEKVAALVSSLALEMEGAACEVVPQ